MHWQYTPYIIPLIVSAIVAIGVTLIAWQRRAGVETLPLVVLMMSLALWCIADALRLGSQDLALKIFWARVRYLGIVFTPAAWYAFVLHYTGRGHWLTGRNLLLLAFEPVIMIVLVWTNGTFHTLVWREIYLREFDSFIGWQAAHGLAFWLHSAYNYLLLGFSLLILILAFQRSQKFYRRQILILLGGASLPLVINVLSVFHLTPFTYLDLTPFAFTLGGVVFAWGLFRFRLMDIIPIAYDTVLDGIGDAVIVLDAWNRIVNLNPAACEMLKCQASDMIALPIQELFREWPDIYGEDGRVREIRTEVALGEDPAQQYYELQASPLQRSPGDLVGWSLVLHDVTMRKLAEQALRAQKQLYESLAVVSRATTEQLDLTSTLENTLKVAAAISDAQGGSLFIVDEAFSVTHSLFTYGAPRPDFDEHTLGLVMQRGLSGWVARNRESVLIVDVRDDDRWVSVPTQEGTHSVLSVPIMGRKDALLGVLTLTHSEVGHFTHEHLVLMEAAAEQMALAWYNAQIYEEQLRLANRLATLYEVLRTVGGALNPKAVPQIAVEIIARLTGWTAVSILMPDESQERLVVQAASSVISVSQGWRVPAYEGIRGRAFKTGETQYVPDLAAEQVQESSAVLVRSQLVLPLRRGHNVLGVLDIGSDRVDAFSADARVLAELLAESIALSLDVAQSHAQIGGYVADLSTLFAMSGVISRSLVLEDLLEQTLNASLRAAGFDAGAIILADHEDGHLEITAEQNLNSVLLGYFEDDGLVGALSRYTYQQGRSVVIADIEQHHVVPAEALDALPDMSEKFRQMGMRACVSVPLLYQDRPIGVLSLFSKPPKPTLLHDIALLMAISRQIATAVVNAQLFRAVEDERGRLYALIESSRDGILFVDMEQHIVVVNTHALELLQLPEAPEYWKRRRLLELFSRLKNKVPDAVSEILAEMQRAHDESTTFGEGEFDLPPHILRWLHLPAMAGSTPLGRLVILRDVTEERLLERMQNDLTHTMVHDLRNPLTGISGALKILKRSFEKEGLAPGQQHMFEILEASTQRMLTLVNAILEIGRLESGKMPLTYDRIRLDALVAGVLDLQMPVAAGKDLSLESVILTDALEAWGDFGLIERVLQNLVGNAIKFTPGGGSVKVIVERDAEETRRFVISVVDTGSGVPLDVQGRLFQKFVTGNQIGRGSGLGLAFCKMVIEAHAERIWLAETLEHGATFRFTLSTPPQKIHYA